MIRNHALLPLAGDLGEADAELAPKITEAALRAILADVPDDWLSGEDTAEATRSGYVKHLLARLAAPRAFVEEAIRAQGV